MNARLICNGQSPHGVRVLLEDGGELLGMTRVTFTANVDDICRIEAEFLPAEVNVEGQLKTWMPHPIDGDLREIAKVIFADGSEWEAA